MKKLPAVKPRRPYMNGVYMESDRDYVENNMTLCVALLDQLAEKKMTKKSRHKQFLEALAMAKMSGRYDDFYNSLPKSAREVSFREFERMAKL